MNPRPTVAETKQKFFGAFTRPISSIYRRVLDELLVELHLLVFHRQFRYDPFFALGLVTAFNRFLVGYAPVADKEQIFDSLTLALGLNTAQLRSDAEQLQQTSIPVLANALQTGKDLEQIPDSLRGFIANGTIAKYSRIFALGLSTALDPYLALLPEAQRQEATNQICGRLGIKPDHLKRDLDFYSQALEQVRRAKEALDEALESDRKKRQPTSGPV